MLVDSIYFIYTFYTIYYVDKCYKDLKGFLISELINMTKRIIITCPDDFDKKVRDFCRENDYNLSAFFRRAVKKLIENDA